MADFRFSIKCIGVNTNNSIKKEMMFSEVDGISDLNDEKMKLFKELKEVDPTLEKNSCRFKIQCI